jgi:hypothetical protein
MLLVLIVPVMTIAEAVQSGQSLGRGKRCKRRVRPSERSGSPGIWSDVAAVPAEKKDWVLRINSEIPSFTYIGGDGDKDSGAGRTV